MNQPDKIIFVGEALVGNEAVDQLTKFNRSLRDFSARGGGAANSKGKGEGRGVDGMILTKFDTIDDKVRWLLLERRVSRLWRSGSANANAFANEHRSARRSR